MASDADVDRQINEMLAAVSGQMDDIKKTVGAIAEMVKQRAAGPEGPEGREGPEGAEGPRGPRGVRGERGERGRDRD